MHICHLGDALSVHVQRQAIYFAKKGYRVSIISFRNVAIEGVEIYHVKIGAASKIKYFLAIPRIKKIVRAINPDILIAHYAASYGFIGAMINFHPLVVSVWGSDVLQTSLCLPYLNFKKLPFVRHALNKADLVISFANHLTEKSISLGAASEKIITITYGVDLEMFEKKSSLPQDRDRDIVISIRPFEPIYNLELLINSIPLVIKNMPQAKFVLIGDGPQKGELQELACQLKTIEFTSFLGKVARSDLMTQLFSANVYVSTSLSDGAPLSLLEAMAAGSFPVVTDIPANREWIVNGENGFLCSPGSPNDLAKKIVIALRDKELRRKAASKNKVILQEKGSYRINMKRIEGYYLQLIKKFEGS